MNQLGEKEPFCTVTHTHKRKIIQFSVFPSPSTDLSVGVQTTARAPFVFVFQVFIRKGTRERKDSGRKSDVGVRRRFESTGRKIWRPLWGTIQNTVPPARTRKLQEMRCTRQGPAAPNGGEGLTQQVMEMM